MLTIYSVGDAWYLGKVMDAIAMISGSNEGFVGASMVAALIGVFVIGFQSILKITLNIHELLVCYIIYMGCFSIQTDVVIESVYSDKTVIQKDNVPYGPAVLGSIISEIGYKLTQKMEVAFSDVHQGTLLTDPNGSQGYANALYLINNLARWSEKNGADTLPTAQNSSFAKNIRTYAMDCTTKALYLGKEFGGKEWKDLKTNSFINALGFNSDVYGTELYINNRAESYTCKEGINAIKDEFKNMLSAIDAGGNESARKEMLVNVGLCKNTQECNANIATNITDLVQNNLDALRVRNYDINDFMMAAVGMNELYTGLSLGYSSMFDKQSSTMIMNAVMQRNIQWGAEQNMFLQSVRPMLSFIEGLFYAISPFAAIMVMLGIFGLKIFFKYIILLIWIQLWLPIMAIANHYIMASASEAIDKLPYQGTGDNMGMSLYFYENLVQICQTKIAVGGMMMAATPVLSLMLITGSVYAMTQLTNRMSGGDHINEKMLAPDVVGTAPIMQMSPGSTNDAYTSKESGAVFKEISVGSILQNSAQYAHEDAMTATKNFAHSIQGALTNSGSHNYSQNLKGMTQDMMTGSNADAFNHMVDNFIDRNKAATAGYSRSQVAQAMVHAGINAQAGSNVSNGKGGDSGAIGTGLGAGVTQSQGISSSQSELDKAAQGWASRMSDTDSATLTKSAMGSLTKENGSSDQFSVDASNLDQYTKSYQTAVSANDKYASIASATSSINANKKMDSVQLAERMERLQTGSVSKLEDEVKALYEAKGGNWTSVVNNAQNTNHPGASNFAHEAAVLEAIDSIKHTSNDINNKFAEYIAPHFGIDPDIYNNMPSKVQNNGKIDTSNTGFSEEGVNAGITSVNSRIEQEKAASTEMTPEERANAGKKDANALYKKKADELDEKRRSQIKEERRKAFNPNMTKEGTYKSVNGKPLKDSAITAIVRNMANVDNVDLDNLDLSKQKDLDKLNEVIKKHIDPIFKPYEGRQTGKTAYDDAAIKAAKNQLMSTYITNYTSLTKGKGQNNAMFFQNSNAHINTAVAFESLAKKEGATEQEARIYGENVANAIDNAIYFDPQSLSNIRQDVLQLYPRK